MMKIGAQFYTLRSFCGTPEDLALSLRKVADIGYTTVQISGTCPFDAGWLSVELERNGLQCVLTHTPADRLCGDLQQVVREHEVFRCHNIGLGYYPFNEEKDNESYAHFLRTFRPVAEQIRAGGKYFMYHHHAHEFGKLDGKLILERIAEDFSPEMLGVTLDTYWVQAGGGDPAQWIERLAGRVPCIHLKDFAFDRQMAVIGEGNINFDRVFMAAENAGTQYMLVEQDDCHGEDPFECLRRSYLYLRAQGFC